MKNTYLRGESVYLRALEPEDLSFLYMLENNSELWEVSSFTVPYSRYILKEFITQSQYDIFADKQLRLIIALQDTHTIVGTIDVTDFVPLHRRGAVGIALLKEYRNKGYASEALRLLCEYTFNFLHLKQLYAHIPEDNKASLHLFTSCGFERGGIMKEWIQTNEGYKDAVFMQKINLK
ncbi:MAG: GNAT family N-acetyltransferase [Bacteroides sp.]|nr:GNAT family N-acetyltransferase [Bacteroides sp.]